MMFTTAAMLIFAGALVLTGVAVLMFILKQNPSKIIEQNKSTKDSQSLFVKKYDEADVFEMSGNFSRIGIVLALAVVILAFSYTKYDRKKIDLGQSLALEEIEVEAPQTQREITPPPPPPPPEIKVVENTEVIEEEDNIVQEEVTEETVVKPPAPVQMQEEVVKEDEIFQIVEEMPEFPGGQDGLVKYLGSITYPPIARENDIEGTVYVKFVIDKNGQVTNAEVARGADKILNEAALAHVKKMPAWKPGKQRGKPVRVQYVVPIKFKLS
jgi:periplasmic protein TonB